MGYLATEHKTFVHHIALDPSGSLLASCSSDKSVEVFYRHRVPCGEDRWRLGCTMADHYGPVLRLSWCQHREHGPLLATAGADRWIYVYRIVVSSHKGNPVVQSIRWLPVRGYEKDAITDVAFVPPQLYQVLLLSTASLDGSVRVYEVHKPLQFPCICKIMPEACGPTSDVSGVATKRESTGSILKTSDGIGGASPISQQAELLTSAAGRPPGLTPLMRSSASPVSPASPESPNFSSGCETALCGPAQWGSGISSIAWFPSATESTMTLAVGAVSGRFYMYRYLKESTSFESIALPPDVVCQSSIEGMQWAPPLGRCFQLIAICSRSSVLILRMNTISPSYEAVDKLSFELYKHPTGAVSASWSRSATLLHLATDDQQTEMFVLQMRDPTNHQSWELVSSHHVPLPRF
ncbi:unnamed protein product [Phytomonas sp. Hart1]|nr:unnamed protein product [Phytomonas sp. Hart1]|eukprot:CCW70561.1 unnamed protein product [Phytomonas sp. isolate Hart1]